MMYFQNANISSIQFTRNQYDTSCQTAQITRKSHAQTNTRELGVIYSFHAELAHYCANILYFIGFGEAQYAVH